MHACMLAYNVYSPLVGYFCELWIVRIVLSSRCDSHWDGGHLRRRIVLGGLCSTYKIKSDGSHCLLSTYLYDKNDGFLFRTIRAQLRDIAQFGCGAIY